MGKVFFYMTVSVDGFVAGPADEVDRLFRWYFSGDTEIPIPGSPTLKVSKESAEILLDASRTGGAMVTGRRNFDIAQAWGGNPPTSPCFVLTHSVPDDWAHEGSPFVFVTDGIESAIGQAKEAAGERMSRSARRPCSSRPSTPGWSTRSTSTSCRCSLAGGSASSITSRSSPPISRSSASCRRLASRTFAIESHDSQGGSGAGRRLGRVPRALTAPSAVCRLVALGGAV